MLDDGRSPHRLKPGQGAKTVDLVERGRLAAERLCIQVQEGSAIRALGAGGDAVAGSGAGGSLVGAQVAQHGGQESTGLDVAWLGRESRPLVTNGSVEVAVQRHRDVAQELQIERASRLQSEGG